MKNPLRILHVEDSPKDSELVETMLQQEGIVCEVLRVDTRADYVSALEQGTFGLILGDYSMPGFDGLSALKIAREKCPEVPFIFVSGTLGEDIAIEALKHGATDYVLKDRLPRFIPCVMRALHQVEEQKEHKRAQEALQESEARKKAMLESALDAIIAIDHQGKILEFNPAAERTFGYSLDQVIGKPLADLIIPPRLREKHKQGLKHYIATGEGPFIGKVVEVTAMCADGAEFPAELAITPIGRKWPPMFLGHIRNITERKQAQEEVQRNLERIRALHEIDVAISSTLDLGKVLEILLEKIDLFLPYAAATVRLLDKRTGLLEPIACRHINESEWRERLPAGRTRSYGVLNSKTHLVVRDIQTSPETRDQEFFRKWGLVSALVVPLIAKDEALGILSFYTKEEHEFTREEIELLTTLAGQAAIAIHNARLYEESNRSRKELELTNRYLERSLKQLSALHTALAPLTPTESVREMMDGIIERLMDVTGADAALIRVRDDVSGALVRASQRGFPDDYLKEVDIAPSGGAPDWVINTGEPLITPNIAADSRFVGKRQLKIGLHSCAMLPLKVRGEIRGIIHLSSRQLGYFDEEQRDHLAAIARQMGIALENRELFDNLRASRDELEKANKIKDEFLSVMSHELRTPLNVVVGYTGMIKDGMLGEVNPQQAEALEKVIRRTNDQLALVNNILYATVLESEGIKVETQDFNLEDFLNQLKLGYDAPINKELSLNWDYPFGLPIIRTDSAKLKHILQNLIDNAIKFTAKGSITISAKVSDQPTQSSELKTQNFQRWVEFKVADTGVGIPKEYLPFVFDKFRQVDSSETRLYGGVGMGLYIVKKFAELLGGTVEVESESETGKGTTFTITIPCGK